MRWQFLGVQPAHRRLMCTKMGFLVLMAAAFILISWLRPGRQQLGRTPVVGRQCRLLLCRRNLQEACWPARPTGMTNESLSLPADVL